MATRRRGAAPRRKRIWTRDFGTDVILGTAPFARDLMALWQVSGGPNLIGCTVVRTRLTLAAARTSGASVLPHVIWGVVVAEASADAADLDPSLAAAGLNLDWMYWSKEYLADQTGLAVASLGVASWTVDVKSMRKLEELGQTLWLVGVSTLADNYAISWGASSLVLLP